MASRLRYRLSCTFSICHRPPVVNKPSPAIIAQSAVRRLPRLALLLFCVAYVLPGFFGRSPWRYEDIAAFGAMQELAATGAHWFAPQVLGQTIGFDALLPYWLGALAIKLLPFLDPVIASRLPFGLLLGLTLLATWYGTYYLARSPQAQPVAFAFGGEALPVDYARAIADAGLLALIASLGLAQLSHETTPALAQLGFSALAFSAMASNPYRPGPRMGGPAIGLMVGLGGLALSGAATMALLLGVGGIAVEWIHRRWGSSLSTSDHADDDAGHAWRWTAWVAGVTAVVALLAWSLDLWRWRIHLPSATGQVIWSNWRSLGRLLFWFTWPSWPLAVWTLWRWRRQLASRHVLLPVWFVTVAVAAALSSASSDRNLLLALPALAALAAFALPTLKRSVASLVDWFTLLFFTGCALVIWVVWFAMQTGWPAQPAANVSKLAPGFDASFSAFAFLLALAASLAWAWLVKWRTGAHRAAVWRSLVLPAGGATLCWLLLMTLWLPLLDYARSYAPFSRQIASQVNRQGCIAVHGLDAAQVAALRYHGNLTLEALVPSSACNYLVVHSGSQASMADLINLPDWAFLATVRRPTDASQSVAIYKRLRPVVLTARTPQPVMLYPALASTPSTVW